MEAKKILVTGAGGFIGGFIVAEALNRGYETWAAVRHSTNRQFLQDERIHFIELDFTSEEALRGALAQHIKEHGKWDYVVHNLGATKCVNYNDFNRINYGYLKELADALIALDAVPQVFLMMSSLSVMGQGDEKTYAPFKPTDVPMPNTRYGVSKLKAETYLQTLPGFPYTIFRCTGVYGPHERDYYLMMKSIQRGFDFSVGFKKQMLTFIYVKDLANAIMDALERGPLRQAYNISEEQSYSQAQFRHLVMKELGKRFCIPIVCPLWLLRLVCGVCDFASKFTGKASTLNGDKYNILKQRKWLCDVSASKRDFGFNPQYTLQQGLHETIAWYRQAHWL